MMRKIIYLVCILVLASFLFSCGYPEKSAIREFSTCKNGENRGNFLFGVTKMYYKKLEQDSCTGTVRVYDVAVWHESAYDSRKIRGDRTATIGCFDLTPASTTEQGYKGTQGHSKTVVTSVNFTQYPPDAIVKRAIIGFHSPTKASALLTAQLRGRLNVGDIFQSLAANRNITAAEKDGSGWIYFDITHFAARAINERRNGVTFELSMPCVGDGSGNADVSILKREPIVVVEYK